jgi:hypothetical protein
MNLMFWKKKPPLEEDANNREKPIAKPGLLIRLKSGFANLGQRFKKTLMTKEAGAGSPREEEDDKTVAMEVLDLGPQPKTGLLARVKAGFSGLARRFGKAPAPGAEGATEGLPPNAQVSPETQTGEPPASHPMRTKKRLIIGGAAGLLVLLLGVAAWKMFLSSPEPETAEPVAASHNKPPESQAETEQAEVETLRKKNEELQAQIEALKKEAPQDDLPTATAEGANAAASAAPGEMTLSNKDPKAAAQSLKEAIEAMNASSGGSVRKPAKQKPPAEAGGD